MTDIVERLRTDAAAWGWATHTVTGPRVEKLETEAADEIERLRAGAKEAAAEIERLQLELWEIKKWPKTNLAPR
jgi:hypothetical protein